MMFSVLMTPSNRLLTSPFEYTQSFDAALKDVVKHVMPGKKESADEVVCLDCHIERYSSKQHIPNEFLR